MSRLQFITAWEAEFDCSFSMVVDALRDLLIRLRSRKIRPLAFGFTESGMGAKRTFIDYKEGQHDQVTTFLVLMVNYNQKTGRQIEKTLGVFQVYTDGGFKTCVTLQCPLGHGALHIDNTVEIAKHFANEARGHGVTVDIRSRSIDRYRTFVVSATINDLVKYFEAVNIEQRAFGYWIEVPEKSPGGQSHLAFFILKTDGSSPRLMASRSPWWRHEVGVIECLQIKDKTQLTMYAPDLQERDHFWAYTNILLERLRAFGFLVDSGASESDRKPLKDAKAEILEFRALVERQTYRDIYVQGKPQENIARALLQSYLTSRSYREVPVRGGQSDVLVFFRNGRFLYETKIWRGPKYYERGLAEIEEYVIGEDSDQELRGIFYLIFDPTKSQRARAHLGGDLADGIVCNRRVETIIVNLALPKPSQNPS